MNDTTEKKPEDMCLSEIITLARDQISKTRGILQEAVSKYGFKDRVEHVCGLLTCGLVALYDSNEDIIKHEIKVIDRVRGRHLTFRPRGIGLDMCPCCFVCGATERGPDTNEYLHNISAFIASKEDGEQIVEWFEGRAKVDFRKNEPNWIQLKVGSCEVHLDKLRRLYDMTNQYGVIRKMDIEDVITQSGKF
jgi:hypothetical protein